MDWLSLVLEDRDSVSKKQMELSYPSNPYKKRPVLNIVWVRLCAAHMGGFLDLKFSKVC